MTDTSEEAARRRAQEQLTAATSAMVTQGNIEAEKAEAKKKAKAEAKKKVGSVWGLTARLTELVKGAGMSACQVYALVRFSWNAQGQRCTAKIWVIFESAQHY